MKNIEQTLNVYKFANSYKHFIRFYVHIICTLTKLFKKNKNEK